MVKRKNLWLIALSLIAVIAGKQVWAQLPQPNDRFLQASPSLAVIAPDSTRPVQPSPIPDPPTDSQAQTIQVQKIEVTGSTIFGPNQLNPILKPYEGRLLTLEQLREVADKITQLYLDRGYITSRAIIPDQAITDKTVQIRVIEGTLEQIQIEGTRNVNPDYIRDRVQRSAGTPLNTGRLEQQLRLLRAEPLFENLEASLRAGTGVGRSILIVRVVERGDYIRSRVQLSGNSPLNVASASLFERLKSIPIAEDASEQIRNYESLYGAKSLVTATVVQDTLKTSERQTGTKSAIIYAVTLPDQLELVLLLPEGNLTRKVVPQANATAIGQTVTKFRQSVTNITESLSYLDPAQQLYNWLIRPLESDLQAQGINTVIFSMDVGLSSLPLAALHDGQKFLVEKYSVGLIPSLSLTDTRYVDIRKSQVLAMGASQFSDPNLGFLPSVSVELGIIMQLWQGKSFLNQEFTVENLESQHQQKLFRIIHLATYADFQPGKLEDSYIQFWDTRLRLAQLRQLGLNNPPVELLVLSSTRTALGSIEAELGFAGLAVQAGVKTVLGSLWYISDQGTLALMAEFYQQLRSLPTKAEALRQAQIAMLKGQVRLENGQLHWTGGETPLPRELAQLSRTDLSHPYYWAGFTIVGNPW
jgi:CHAT domain-containing protein